MSKKSNANKAIDFARLFAVKDQLARQESAEATSLAETERVEVEHVELDDAGGEGRGQEINVANENVIAFPSAEEATPIEVTKPAPATPANSSVQIAIAVPISSSPTAMHHAASPVVTKPKKTDALPDDDEETFLRVGITRDLHERVKAYASLMGKSSTEFTRDVLESRTPVFDTAMPMGELAKLARGVVGVASNEPRPTEVRMKAPVTTGLHRRLQQLAALRKQTLGACLVDVLEASVPKM